MSDSIRPKQSAPQARAPLQQLPLARLQAGGGIGAQHKTVKQEGATLLHDHAQGGVESRRLAPKAWQDLA